MSECHSEVLGEATSKINSRDKLPDALALFETK